MEEAKSLVHMCITALFAALILAAVLALITLGNIIWRAFSNQNDANRRLREYSSYSAFDGTSVRGQDVIALLHDTQGSPFVIIYDMDNHKPISVAFNSVEADYAIANSIPTTQNAADDVTSVLGDCSGHVNRTIKQLAHYIENDTRYEGSGMETQSGTNTFNFTSVNTAPSYATVQQWFLSRGEAKAGEAGYLPYRSYLLYDGDDTTDVIGILLIEDS